MGWDTPLPPLSLAYAQSTHGEAVRKYQALRLDVGNFSWDSKCSMHKTRIVDICNASSNELVSPKTPVQNWIVLIDSTLYPQWSEPRDTTRRGAKLTPEEEEILNTKRSKKIQKKYDERKKECQNQQSSGGAVPARQASGMPGFKARPVWPSRWLCARGQGARVPSEENQSPERQINLPLFYLWSCKEGVDCLKKKM
ncbi:unnamed protein product [Gulo gulo]|uniref:Uncharacterized protein n=1 Tax=Gulo gulo TaxID=48420 RepID=A0A9X9Q1T6_GULGU|nr:unnamed protein product [Gulo gulo]